MGGSYGQGSNSPSFTQAITGPMFADFAEGFGRRINRAPKAPSYAAIQSRVDQGMAAVKPQQNTVNNTHTANITVVQEGRSGRTEQTSSKEETMRKVSSALDQQAVWNGNGGAGAWGLG